MMQVGVEGWGRVVGLEWGQPLQAEWETHCDEACAAKTQSCWSFHPNNPCLLLEVNQQTYFVKSENDHNKEPDKRTPYPFKDKKEAFTLFKAQTSII